MEQKQLPIRKEVPCNGCTACCKKGVILLHPEFDPPDMYQSEPIYTPFGLGDVRMLAHKPNGDCYYLGPKGCTIHDYAPYLCRKFDCRIMYLEMPKEYRRIATQLHLIEQPVLNAARKRLKTLTKEELDEFARRANQSGDQSVGVDDNESTGIADGDPRGSAEDGEDPG